VLNDKEEQSIEQTIIAKSGKKIPIIDTGNYANIDGEEYVIGQAIDISRLKKTERNLLSKITEIEKLRNQLEEENIFLKESAGIRYDFKEIIGKSGEVLEILDRIRHIATAVTPVILIGETGTGKELIGRAVHEKSQRSNKRFIKVDLAALPEDMIECVLFGCEKDSIPEAFKSRSGKIALAHEGTLFIDFIDKMPLVLQPKLLRLIETGEFERIGDPQTLKVDIRVICATTANLNILTEQGLFRKNLYYALLVYPLKIVPLHDRLTDIPLLVKHFVERFNAKHNKKVKRFTKAVIRKLEQYPWPGNIRELENVIERSVIISPATKLVLELQQTQHLQKDKSFLPLDEFEKKYIKEILKFTKGRIDGSKGAARILDLHPETLRSKMRKLGIKRKS
jgi:transcriptional regulator with GAF, ATPase, and Fis domain